MSGPVIPPAWDLGSLLRAGRHVNPIPADLKKRRVIAPKPPTIGPSGWARRKVKR